MVNEATIEAYKAMAKDSACPSMEAQIRENLERTCEKFAGNEDKFERCISYLEECAQEILEGKNGDVPDEVCFRICRDYFNDEIWKAEDEEKAEREKAQAEERARLAAEKKAKSEKGKKAKKAKSEKANSESSAPRAAEPVETAPENDGPEKDKFQTCRECGKEFINLFKDGMCVDCYKKKTTEDEKSAPAHAAKNQPDPDQLDFYSLMGA